VLKAIYKIFYLLNMKEGILYSANSPVSNWWGAEEGVQAFDTSKRGRKNPIIQIFRSATSLLLKAMHRILCLLT
jgi:hypothetical protein